MKKLLHERLREIDDEEHNRCDLCVMMHDGACPPYMCDEALIRGAYNLADEIERYYIPRPRFEDGEPVQFGDETETLEHVDEILFTKRGVYELHKTNKSGYGANVSIYGKDELVKRPQPKVLDADGVEIKVGDTVWYVDSGGKYTITAMCSTKDCVIADKDNGGSGYHLQGYFLTHKGPVLDSDGVPINVGDTVWLLNHSTEYTVNQIDDPRGLGRVMIIDEDAFCEWHMPHRITHKEPDSLEKLRDDIQYYAQSIQTGSNLYNECTEFADRLSALIERGA